MSKEAFAEKKFEAILVTDSGTEHTLSFSPSDVDDHDTLKAEFNAAVAALNLEENLGVLRFAYQDVLDEGGTKYYNRKLRAVFGEPSQLEVFFENLEAIISATKEPLTEHFPLSALALSGFGGTVWPTSVLKSMFKGRTPK